MLINDFRPPFATRACRGTKAVRRPYVAVYMHGNTLTTNTQTMYQREQCSRMHASPPPPWGQSRQTAAVGGVAWHGRTAASRAQESAQEQPPTHNHSTGAVSSSRVRIRIRMKGSFGHVRQGPAWALAVLCMDSNRPSTHPCQKGWMGHKGRPKGQSQKHVGPLRGAAEREPQAATLRNLMSQRVPSWCYTASCTCPAQTLHGSGGGAPLKCTIYPRRCQLQQQRSTKGLHMYLLRRCRPKHAFMARAAARQAACSPATRHKPKDPGGNKCNRPPVGMKEGKGPWPVGWLRQAAPTGGSSCATGTPQ